MPLPSNPSVMSQLGRAAEAGATGVMGSIQRAAEATGVDFSYLVKTAKRESSLNPHAKAPTSSAAGLFQFIEQTWLGVLKSKGAKHGYGGFAEHITRGKDGRFHVAADMRKQVLGLRFNADANAVMAAEMTAGHAAYLKGRIGRDPTQGELYVAHFLGPDGAADLVTANANRPGASAAALFPAAARANPTIFYRKGHALSVAEVTARLTRTGGAEPMTLQAAAEPRRADEAFGNPQIVARLDKLRADAAIMQLVFGNGENEPGMLFNAQLLSAFGPDDDNSDQKRNALMKAFGGTGGYSG
jgi:hypothetical protein